MSLSRPARGAFGVNIKAMAAALAAFAAASCAHEQTAHNSSHSKEYFSQAKYGAASPRVVAAGQPVPRGGGQYLVGHPYSIAGRTYYPAEDTNYSAVGMASWYGAAFHGRRTANGEVYDMASLTAAHPTMPLPSYARVTNVDNGHSIIVRVNDRGPYHGGRVMDVSSRVADLLDFKGAGTAKVRVDYVGRAPLEGSDDNRLLASLRTDGQLASIDGVGVETNVQVAEQTRAPEPAPAPKPEPVKVALAPPPPAREPPPAPQPARPALVNAPLPPSRPFDLGTIPGAAVPVAASLVLPPQRPILQASAERALYYVPSVEDRSTRRRRDPFARLKSLDAAAPLSDR